MPVWISRTDLLEGETSRFPSVCAVEWEDCGLRTSTLCLASFLFNNRKKKFQHIESISSNRLWEAQRGGEGEGEDDLKQKGKHYKFSRGFSQVSFFVFYFELLFMVL